MTMARYVATMNTPGYLPWGDGEPPVFGTAREAWEYLADERRRQEDDAYMAGDEWSEGQETDEDGYTLVVRELVKASTLDVVGSVSVYGSTPGYAGDHDLGVAYSVSYYHGDE